MPAMPALHGSTNLEFSQRPHGATLNYLPHMTPSEIPTPMKLSVGEPQGHWKTWGQRLAVAAGCVLLAVCFSGCAANTSTIPEERRSPQSLDKLEAGDVLKVTYMGAKEFGQTVKIPPNGKLSLPYISPEVNAIGKTTATLQKILTDRCTELTNKVIVVTLQESSKRVYISGVARGGPFIVLDHPMTVSEVVAAAGGAPDAALARAVKLRCLENGKVVTYSMHLLKDPKPVYVRPGDEIIVKTPQF
jgi:protein involved in polysaccharide export with SLBB domain